MAMDTCRPRDARVREVLVPCANLGNAFTRGFQECGPKAAVVVWSLRQAFDAG
jgi:hypothetical protein